MLPVFLTVAVRLSANPNSRTVARNSKVWISNIISRQKKDLSKRSSPNKAKVMSRESWPRKCRIRYIVSKTAGIPLVTNTIIRTSTYGWARPKWSGTKRSFRDLPIFTSKMYLSLWLSRSDSSRSPKKEPRELLCLLTVKNVCGDSTCGTEVTTGLSTIM